MYSMHFATSPVDGPPAYSMYVGNGITFGFQQLQYGFDRRGRRGRRHVRAVIVIAILHVLRAVEGAHT
jgi:hypothetical protein